MFNLCSSTWPKSQLRADWAYLHVAVLAGLPISLISDLATELDRSAAQIAEWVTAAPDSTVMSMQAGEVFCRLIEILDALLGS